MCSVRAETPLSHWTSIANAGKMVLHAYLSQRLRVSGQILFWNVWGSGPFDRLAFGESDIEFLEKGTFWKRGQVQFVRGSHRTVPANWAKAVCPLCRAAFESKVGRTSLTKLIRQELARDVKLLRSREVHEVVWEFSRSSVTGKTGPTPKLLAKLNKFGIRVKLNE